MNEPLGEMFRYNAWATYRLLDACAALEPHELAAQVPGSEWTVSRTLLHLVSSLDVFVARLEGRDQFVVMRSWHERGWPGIDALRSAAAASCDRLTAIAEAAGGATFVVQGFRYDGQRSEISEPFLLTHALVHSTAHREQVLTALTVLGRSAPDLDGWAYADGRDLVRRIDD